jgi:thymidylate synthase
VSFSGEKRGGGSENIGGCGEKVENSGEKCKFAGEKKLYHEAVVQELEKEISQKSKDISYYNSDAYKEKIQEPYMKEISSLRDQLAKKQAKLGKSNETLRENKSCVIQIRSVIHK